ncbi:MAG: hypothetical protein R6W68_00240 [Ignavibacteriaceae bacterium]
MAEPQIPANNYKSVNSTKVEKLTAVWALSESTLGGILHALKFPFRGMIISSVAVILICMISGFSKFRGQIIKSTFIVILIKAAISPHTPLTAYLSVFTQGLLGELFFLSKKIKWLSALLLGITVAILNGFQKVLVLTIIYGTTLWKTIDDFLIYIIEEWLSISINLPVNFSYLIIGLYIGIHLIAGIITGILAYRIQKSVQEKLDMNEIMIPLSISGNLENNFKTKKKRGWIKPSALIIFILSLVLILISYLYPETGRFDITAIVIMIARSVMIITVWFYFIAPRVKSLISKYLVSKKSGYAKEAESIISTLPMIRLIISSAWKYSATYKGMKRIRYFITSALVNLLHSTE